MSTGDRLRVVAGEKTIAELEVVSVAERWASCRTISRTRPIATGDVVVPLRRRAARRPRRLRAASTARVAAASPTPAPDPLRRRHPRRRRRPPTPTPTPSPAQAPPPRPSPPWLPSRACGPGERGRRSRSSTARPPTCTSTRAGRKASASATGSRSWTQGGRRRAGGRRTWPSSRPRASSLSETRPVRPGDVARADLARPGPAGAACRDGASPRRRPPPRRRAPPPPRPSPPPSARPAGPWARVRGSASFGYYQSLGPDGVGLRLPGAHGAAGPRRSTTSPASR